MSTEGPFLYDDRPPSPHTGTPRSRNCLLIALFAGTVALAVVAVRVLVGVLPSGDGGAGTGRMVVAVAHDSPADAARIQGGGGAGGAITGQGDVIVRVGKRQIAGPDDLAAAIHDLAPGRQVQIEIVRGGQHHTVPVELADRPG
jgi:S1-C subfamily serine protease